MSECKRDVVLHFYAKKQIMNTQTQVFSEAKCHEEREVCIMTQNFLWEEM